MPSPSSPPYCTAIIGHQQFDIEKVCMYVLSWRVSRQGLERENFASHCQMHTVGRKPARLQINILRKKQKHKKIPPTTHPDSVGQLKSQSPDFEPVCQTLDLAASKLAALLCFQAAQITTAQLTGWTGRSYFKLQLLVRILSKELDVHNHCC